MTMKTTIEVSEDYLVKAQDHFTFFNQTAFQLAQMEAGVIPSLINAGTINVTCDTGGSLIGIVTSGGDFAEGASVWNKAGAHLYVNNEQGYEVYGVWLSADQNRLRNDGEMVIRGGDATEAHGIVAGGDATIINTAQLTVTGGRAGCIEAYETPKVDNSGTMLAAGDQATALTLGNLATLDNTGLIEAQADNGSATAVLIQGSRVGSTASAITNDGRIIATAPDWAATVGIQWFNATGDADHPDVLVNTGLIQAATALFDGHDLFSHGGSNQLIDNSGVIRGRVDLGQGDDHLTNNGRMFGDVDLGDGDDTLDGGGRLSGTIHAGLGSDSVVGTAHADLIYGDDADHTDSFGSDTLLGGGGADTLFGGDWTDRLVGGKGADELTGGAGRDTFAFTAVIDSSVKHADLITDLATGDRIDLSAIDANGMIAGDQAFFLVDSFDRHAGEAKLSYDAGEDVTRLELDVDGDAKADALILLAGDQIGFSGFIL